MVRYGRHPTVLGGDQDTGRHLDLAFLVSHWMAQFRRDNATGEGRVSALAEESDAHAKLGLIMLRQPTASTSWRLVRARQGLRSSKTFGVLTRFLSFLRLYPSLLPERATNMLIVATTHDPAVINSIMTTSGAAPS